MRLVISTSSHFLLIDILPWLFDYRAEALRQGWDRLVRALGDLGWIKFSFTS
jgi:hypothetical protein